MARKRDDEVWCEGIRLYHLQEATKNMVQPGESTEGMEWNKHSSPCDYDVDRQLQMSRPPATKTAAEQRTIHACTQVEDSGHDTGTDTPTPTAEGTMELL